MLRRPSAARSRCWEVLRPVHHQCERQVHLPVQARDRQQDEGDVVVGRQAGGGVQQLPILLGLGGAGQPAPRRLGLPSRSETSSDKALRSASRPGPADLGEQVLEAEVDLCDVEPILPEEAAEDHRVPREDVDLVAGQVSPAR